VCLRDDDRAPPVDGEVQVVGIADAHRAAVAAGARVDRREAVAGVVGDPQRAQVPGRAHVLGQGADREVVDDPGRALVDDVDRVGLRVGHVDARGIAAHLGGQVPRARRRVDVDGRGARRARHGAPGRARQLEDLAVHAGVGVAAAGDEQPAPGSGGREVRQRRRQPARGTDVPGRRIDGPDAAALAGGAVAAPADDVERPAERRAGGVGQARREVTDHPRTMAQRVDADDLVARANAVGSAGHEQVTAHGGRSGVAHGMRERGDLARRAPGPEGQHRAQRRGRRVAADDVGGRAHRHRRRVRHRFGQVPGGPRAPARRHLGDRRGRAAGAAAAEDVEARAQRGGAHVVDGRRQRADAPRRPGRHAHDIGHRAVGGVQATDGEHRVPDPREPRQLHRRGQRARPHHVQSDADGRVLAVAPEGGWCAVLAPCDPQPATAAAASVARIAPLTARRLTRACAVGAERAARRARPPRPPPPGCRRNETRGAPARSSTPAPTRRRRSRSTRSPSPPG
jgi:hypothetical protein